VQSQTIAMLRWLMLVKKTMRWQWHGSLLVIIK